MESYDVEVAVAFTNGIWISIMTQVEADDSDEYSAIEKAAEEKVLDDYRAAPGEAAVSFVKTIWIDPEEMEY